MYPLHILALGYICLGLRHVKTIHFNRHTSKMLYIYIYIVKWNIFKTKWFIFSYHAWYLLDKQNIMKYSPGVGFGRTSKPCEKKIRVILVFEFSSPLLARSTRSNNLFKDFIRIKTFVYYMMVFISVFI